MDQVFLKLQVFISEKIPDHHNSKIHAQDIHSWSAKYLELTTKDKGWYIHDFFETVSNNASSSAPFNAADIAYFNILKFWCFEIFFNNYFRF